MLFQDGVTNDSASTEAVIGPLSRLANAKPIACGSMWGLANSPFAAST